ncbi:MAG TPA: hypothetical protein VN688_00720 [Gemmataceae bacterium]|nr:hypothetical protein [Gemmataceae bacterium]
MLKARVWAMAVLIMVTLAGATVLTSAGRSTAQQRAIADKDHWRHYEGHWSYWHQGDQRWYYTDGTHWYYNDGGAWKLYRFDKKFGRDGFERGEYRIPREEDKIVVPRHKVYRPR